MKSVLSLSLPLSLLLYFSTSAFSLFSQESYTLEFQFSGLESDAASTIYIAVYADESNFLSDNPTKTFTVPTEGKTALKHRITLPNDQYGIAFFQDLNSDKKLNKNFVGYPSEPFSFSNNAPVRFGPPKWTDAQFYLNENRTMQITF